MAVFNDPFDFGGRCGGDAFFVFFMPLIYDGTRLVRCVRFGCTLMRNPGVAIFLISNLSTLIAGSLGMLCMSFHSVLSDADFTVKVLSASFILSSTWIVE
eukprot:scaffold14672_cov61-Attheya_sp.AAC.2